MGDKVLRLTRLMRPCSKRTCIVPMDHGTTLGPICGIDNYPATIRSVINGGADAVILHKGLFKKVLEKPELAVGQYILHLSVSTVLSPDPYQKVLVTSVEEAIKYGAAGVSIHINLGADREVDMIRDFGMVARQCTEWGMPLLAMMYICKKPKNSMSLAHAARLAEELGADMVKIEYPGSFKDLKQILQGVKIPVVIAGGSQMEDTKELLTMIHDALMVGASGVAIGRNIFGCDNPGFMTRLISQLVHEEITLEESIYRLQYMREYAGTEKCI